jgi:hypothetical protein
MTVIELIKALQEQVDNGNEGVLVYFEGRDRVLRSVDKVVVSFDADTKDLEIWLRAKV